MLNKMTDIAREAILIAPDAPSREHGTFLTEGWPLLPLLPRGHTSSDSKFGCTLLVGPLYAWEEAASKKQDSPASTGLGALVRHGRWVTGPSNFASQSVGPSDPNQACSPTLPSSVMGVMT